MALDSLLTSILDNSVTSVTSCNVRDVTLEPALILDVTLVTSVTSQTINSQLEIIKNWLLKIGEPEEDHHLVIDRCKADHEALTYFLRHARGEFEPGYTVTDEQRADDRVKCSDCLYLFAGNCQKYAINNHGVRYRPVQDVLKRCGMFKPSGK